MTDIEFLTANPLEPRLRTAVQEERKGTLIFASIAILFTPVVLLGVILLLMLGLGLLSSFMNFPIEWLQSPLGLPTGFHVVLAFILSVYLGSPRVRHHELSRFERWFLAAGAVYLLLLAMTYATGWPVSRPGLFWSLMGLGSMSMLALLGKGSMSNDSGYLGWYESISGGSGDREELSDLAAEGARFVTFLPGLVIDWYGQIFGSAWLWKHVDPRELRLMAQTLEALRREAGTEARDLLRRDPDVARWLVKLQFMRTGRRGLALTSRGAEFLAGH
jgi:hypothetical protein